MRSSKPSSASSRGSSSSRKISARPRRSSRDFSPGSTTARQIGRSSSTSTSSTCTGPTHLRRPPTPVSLIDIVPTALDVAGLSLAPSLMGRSLRRGLEGGALDRRPTFAESRHKYDYARAIRASGCKYIESFKERSHDRNEPPATRFAPSRLRDPARFSLRRELYRLTDDPLETT